MLGLNSRINHVTSKWHSEKCKSRKSCVVLSKVKNRHIFFPILTTNCKTSSKHETLITG